MTTGERIKQLRESLGMTQVSLADAIGEKKQTLYKYENNYVTNIPIDKIELIAKSLNTSPAFLMGWDDPEEKEKLVGLAADELEEELFNLCSRLTPAQKQRQIQILRDILGVQDK